MTRLRTMPDPAVLKRPSRENGDSNIHSDANNNGDVVFELRNGDNWNEDGPLVAHSSNHVPIANGRQFYSENGGSHLDDADETGSSPLSVSNSPPNTRIFSGGQTREEKLLELTNRTKYSIMQRNGQRIYGGPPPGWQGPPPPKGCEIFVGKVPRDCYEYELVPIFETMGKIYELRLMMDFSGTNRGYFFVRYTNKEDAKQAVRNLNNYEIRPNKRLGVIYSVDNRKLWISGIPKNRTPAEIKWEIEKMTDGVRDVILYPSQTDKSRTRGYAFVEYETHRAAALARRKLVPGRIFILGHEVDKVDWAEPENEVDEDVLSKVRILFVRNLMPSTTEHQIRATFDNLSDGQVERVKKTKDYAFVHFETRQAAEKAKAEAAGLVMDGACLEVLWSKPVDKQIYNTRKQLTKALTTLPPRGSMEFPAATGLALGCGARGIAPRRRGAAGVKGLGAPGTQPPAALVRKVVGNGGNIDGYPEGRSSQMLLPSYASNGGNNSCSQLLHALHSSRIWGDNSSSYSSLLNDGLTTPINSYSMPFNVAHGLCAIDPSRITESFQAVLDAGPSYYAGGLLPVFPGPLGPIHQASVHQYLNGSHSPQMGLSASSAHISVGLAALPSQHQRFQQALAEPNLDSCRGPQ